MPIGLSGPYGGLFPPAPIAGMALSPYGYVVSGDFTVTANRVYYAPFPVFRTTAFAGFKFQDQGTGNNGKNVRAAIFSEAAGGGPGALLKDFGAVALTGTAGIHNIANSVTVGGPQMCYLALVSDSTPSLVTMDLIIPSTAAGYLIPPPLSTLLGDLADASFAGGSIVGGVIIGWYAAQTYGAFPGTATAPTNSIQSSNTAAYTFPAMKLYL